MAGGTETPHIAAPPALARLAPFAIAQKSYFALNGAIGDAADSVMKTMSAREAKNGFGLMIDSACRAGADRKARARGRV